MSDIAKLALSDRFQTPVTFASDVGGIGFLNGVINVTLVTAMFTPADDKVNADLVISARLRFDLFVAQKLYKMLGDIIDANTKGLAETPATPKMDS